MSFEDKLHKKIEEGNSEEKKRVWEKLSSELRFSEEEDGVRAINRRRKLLMIAPVFIAFLLFLLIFCLAFFGRENRVRYCAAGDYTFSQSEKTLKDYSEENKGKILYFDWYEVTSLHSSQVATLNKTQEVICFSEDLCDEETGYIVSLSVTDSRTVLESFDDYDFFCSNSEDGIVTIKWGGDFDSYAIFEYDGFRYYLMVKESDRKDLARDYALQLLNP